MGNNDIALNFDTLEYYSLQEASDYLNRKYKINNIKPKKLLKQISSRRINTFIHFRMDNISNSNLKIDFSFYNSNIYSNEIYNLSEEEVKSILRIIDKVEKFVSNSLINDLYMGYVLFKVDEYTLFNMSLDNNVNSETQLLAMDGFIYSSTHNDNPHKPSQLKKWSLYIEDKEYYLSEIYGLDFVIDSTNDEQLNEFVENAPLSCSFNKHSDFSRVELSIKIDNLIILYKDLLKLEQEVINDKPIDNITRFKARKGISQQKVLAKEFAKHIAGLHWKQDDENSIKISEMCEIVWSKLIESGFDKQLPDSAKSLKPWIKEVSPSYASEAGRPQS